MNRGWTRIKIENQIKLLMTKEIGRQLADVRKQSYLTQAEVGKRLGFSAKTAKIYISKLERGVITNPSLWLVLDYLTICEKPWSAFFDKLANIYFMKKHWILIGAVPAVFSYRKTDKAVAHYEYGLDNKFAYKQKIKPLTEFQKQKMATGYARYQAFMHMIEKDITRYLGDSGEPYGLNQFYKAFARQYYSAIRKYQTQMDTDKKKEKSSVDIGGKNLDKIFEQWMNRGLKREILEKVKEVVDKNLSINITVTDNAKIKN